jgi:ATP-binding cassette subfamily B protein IrtA
MENVKELSPLARLADFAAPHRAGYIAAVILAVLGVASGLLPYFAMAQMIIQLVDGGKKLAFYLEWCGIAAAGFGLKVILMSLSTTLSHQATFAVISEVRFRLASKLTRVPMGYLLDIPSGKLKTTMVEKVDSIEPTLAHVLPEMTSNLLVPLGIIIYLFTLDWRMALVSLATLPVGFLCYLGMTRNYAEKFAAYTNARKHMSATTVEYVNGIEVIKAFNQSANSYDKFTDAVKQNAAVALDWIREVQVYFAMGLGIWPAVLIGVLPVGCLFYMNGTLSAPTFITIMILSLGIIAPILAAMYYTDDLAQIGTIIGDIGRILDTPELERPGARKKLNGAAIELKGVTFAYHDEPVLKGIDLKIEAGSVTALVGPSGGGKSTIAKLIASFWDASGGTITLGGVDIKQIPLEQLMENIAYVAQDNYLFDDTVRNNIRMGRPDASDAEVEEVAKASGCHEFIMKLEHGYDTVAGGAGGHLSGGERQRIAIARAMLKNAPVVILDEATAYTDPENEAVIQEAVAGLVRGKTLIVIAHRLSTIINSDQIVVIENGKVIAAGKHENLLENCALYRNMWRAHSDAQDEL